VSLATTRYPRSVAGATAELAIGAAALFGWSHGLELEERKRLLGLTAWPAAVLSTLALFQATGLYRPFEFAGDARSPGRLQITSLAGNPGDLGAYLVLPCLLLQARAAAARGARRAWLVGALVLCGVGVALTQTFTALAALVLGSATLWLRRLPWRRAVLAVAT